MVRVRTSTGMVGWEPKVAKLEATIESVTKDIASLTVAVREISSTMGDLAHNTATQFEKLAVGLTSATAPKRVDWQVLIAGGALCMALVGAVIYPITIQIENVKEYQLQLANTFREHVALPLHPVGSARIDAIEKDHSARMVEITKELDVVREEGSPVTRARLAVLEDRLNHIGITSAEKCHP